MSIIRTIFERMQGKSDSGTAPPIEAAKPQDSATAPQVEFVSAADRPARPPTQIFDPAQIEPADAVPTDTTSTTAPASLLTVNDIEDDGDPELKERIIEAGKTVRDPEIPVNLFDLGLIYDLNVNREGKVAVEMTLTTPNCPSAAMLPEQMKQAIRSVEGVTDVGVRIVFSPPWNQEMMSLEARLELGML